MLPIDINPDIRIHYIECDVHVWIRWDGEKYACEHAGWVYDTSEKDLCWFCGDATHHTRMSGIKARDGFQLYGPRKEVR